MAATRSANGFDVIVIGSGMGGITTAAALSRFDHQVLLLEQAQSNGGLTHIFSRNDCTWNVGHDQEAGRILDAFSGGTIEFRSVGTVYDTLHFPDVFEISVGRPAEGISEP